ncbi:MAG: MarR family transcriptional regulator [Streptosporangiales bacterium]|nr:MarR family transcriptional regulator [Streptosporangiales bacterium]
MSDARSQWLSDDFQPAFWTAKRAMVEAAEAAYRRHGVREGQQFILMCLWEEDGLTPGEIARRLGLATPTVTKATKRMEPAGLVVRKPHPSDARLVLIYLTDRGRNLEKVLDEEMRRLSGRALRTLSEEEQAQFIRFLHELRRNLTDA